MRNNLLLFFTLFFCTNKIVSQSALSLVYEIKTDTVAFQQLGSSYWEVIEDVNENLNFDQIREPLIANKFHRISLTENRINYSIHSFWIRYRLKNLMSGDAKICLDNTTKADQSDFYLISSDNNWQHYTTGYLNPWSQRDGLKKIDVIPILIKPGESIIVYNRIKNNYYFNKPDSISVRIGNTDSLIQKNYILNDEELLHEKISWLFVGILLCACVVNFFFYLIVKEIVFIYYILFLIYFSFGGYTIFFTEVFFKNNSPTIFYFLHIIIGAFGIPLFVQFMRHFLNNFSSFPILNRLLQIVSTVSPLTYITGFFIEPYLPGKYNGFTYAISSFFFDLGLILILTTIICYSRNHGRLVRVLIVSAFPSTVFWAFGFTITDIYNLLLSQYNFSQPHFIVWLNSNFDMMNMLSVIWLVLSFSLILILRFMDLRKQNIQQALEKIQLEKEIQEDKNKLIEQQKVELESTVTKRTLELQRSLENLKSTQSQLIQSEKMASLGELTAGIAHEIQNPLNFVNNFSDVNQELLTELKDEADKGNLDEVKAIANDVIENEGKINHHGKRAEAIVKGMLQHSRTSSGQKEPTNINALCDEYLRLAYHGLRAKDKEFNAIMKTDFDESIGNINIIPQDIGRVLLNLYNNAFYAVAERKKQIDNNYEPTVLVNTKKINDKVEIRVSDNGNGIPQKVVDKIFQPFFTTKPTGQGTGLGLSLSYDIIKTHGGEIKVETKEGEGSEFVIMLPA